MYNKLLYSSHSQTHHNEEGFYLQNKMWKCRGKKILTKTNSRRQVKDNKLVNKSFFFK